MKPVKMTLELYRDTGDIETGEGEVFTMIVVGDYYPGEDGYRSGHPDGWTEDIGHYFEVLSATAPDGEERILTEKEDNEILDLAWERFHNR